VWSILKVGKDGDAKIKMLKDLLGKESFQDEIEQMKMLEHEEEVVLNALDAEDGIYEELEDDFVKQAEGEEEFEEVYQEYEEEDEYEEIKAEDIAPESELQDALKEFMEDHPSMFDNKEGVLDKLAAREVQIENNHCLKRVLEQEEPDLDVMYEKLVAKEPEDRFDVETIVSTYTNTDNRPAVVSLTQAKPKKMKSKEGMDTHEEKESKEKIGTSGHRDRTETKEQRKERKAAIKLQKKESRLKKKELKILYKQEQLKQQKRDSMAYDIKDGLSVIKL